MSTAASPDLELLSKLVAIPSLSGQDNEAIVDLIADMVDADPGVTVERHPMHDGRRGWNLICRKGPETGPARQGLVLSGHLDVVPASDQGWDSDPFTLTTRGDRVFGRGSCDMKPFIAQATNRFNAIASDTLTHPLVLVFSHDEEVGCLGAQSLVHTDPSLKQRLPRHALIGEPTSLQVVRMHKGHLKGRFHVKGTAAHSGFPHLGDNAIERATRLLTRLIELRESLEQHREPTSAFFPEVPYPALNVASIAGGVAINVVPPSCSIEVGVRLLPGMDTQPTIDALANLAESDPAFSFELINDTPPMLEGESAPIVREAMAIMGQTDTVGVSFASDAGALQRDLGMSCILFGPGSITVAHRPNEWLPLDELTRAGDAIDTMIQRFCLTDEVP